MTRTVKPVGFCAETLSSHGVLPAYVTENDNWDNARLLGGYRNYYQSNVDQWKFVASRPVDWTLAALAAIPIVRGSKWVARGAAFGLGAGSYEFGDFAQDQIRLNEAKRDDLTAHIQVLDAGC